MRLNDLNNLKDFEVHQAVIDIQFALMLKFRFNYEKRFDMVETNIKNILKEHFSDKNYIHKIMETLELKAYHEIPGEFWQTLKT